MSEGLHCFSKGSRSFGRDKAQTAIPVSFNPLALIKYGILHFLGLSFCFKDINNYNGKKLKDGNKPEIKDAQSGFSGSISHSLASILSASLGKAKELVLIPL